MKLIYELIEGKPLMNNPILIEDDAEIPKGHVELDGRVSYTEDGEVFSLSLDSVKETKISELNNQCEATILGGFVASNGHTFAFDTYDQMNFTQQGTLLQLDSTITDVTWKTEDAGILTFTVDEFVQILKDAEAHKRNNIGKYWTLKMEVVNAETEEEIQNIVW